MGATASRTDDFPDTDSDPHPLDLLPLVTRPLSSVDPPNTISNSLSIAELKWNFGGSSVYVTGAWDSWKSKYALYRTQHNEFTAILLLPVGTFQYKFIVDGNWKYVFYNNAYMNMHVVWIFRLHFIFSLFNFLLFMLF